MSEKLLIVEDDKKLNDGIRLALKNDACVLQKEDQQRKMVAY